MAAHGIAVRASRSRPDISDRAGGDHPSRPDDRHRHEQQTAHRA
jgi:hypothetical protein